MKKLLSILICVLLGVGGVWAQQNTISLAISPEGKGVAKISGVDFNYVDGTKVCKREVWGFCVEYYYPDWNRDITGTITSPTTATVTSWGENGSKYYTENDKYYHNAEVDLEVVSTQAGYVFEKWTSSNNNTVFKSSSTASIAVADLGESSRSSNLSVTITANFHTCFQATLYGYDSNEDEFYTTPLGAMWADEYSDGMTLNVGQFKNLYKVEFIHPINDITKVKCSSEEFECRISVIGNDTVLEVQNKGTINGTVNGTVKLSVNGEWNKNRVSGGTITTLSLTVSNEPLYVTLNPAEDLSGRYTYTQNTTGAEEYEVTTSAIVKQMVSSTDYSFTFNPMPYDETKMQFEKWVIKDEAGNIVYMSITPNLSYTFKAGQSITPVFVPKDVATYIVKIEPNITYTDLQMALDRADELTDIRLAPQTVVVTSKTGRLLQGNYTIRNGVTLLIPGESSYIALLGDLAESHFTDETGKTRTSYCTWTVDDNTTITVEDGNISLYAKLTATNTTQKTGAYEHGHMELGKNCQITVVKGGLYAFGFITGDKSSGILMKPGTITYEPFHMTDWRGGTETLTEWVMGSAGKNSKVFPVGQYYIQSIEVPITFEAGAIEKISCCVDVGISAPPVNMVFIAHYDDAEGLFGLGSNTTITKVYDPLTDRLKFEYRGNGASTSKVKVGCMNLQVMAYGMMRDVNSKDYVMPIQNNMDVDVKNTTIDIKYDLAYMPGSVMRVHDDAVINIGSSNASDYKPNVYIYDRGARLLDDGTPYWQGTATAAKPIVPVVDNFRPGGIQYKRTDADLVDARLIINGDMNLYGALYTVKGKHTENDNGTDPKLEGGASIMSEGSGKINVNNSLGTATTTKQWKYQNGAQTLALSSPNLKLRNELSKGADSAYTHVKLTNVSYTYYQHDGMWRLPQAGPTGVKLYDSEDNEVEHLLVNLPTATTVDGYLLATLEQTGVNYEPEDFDVTLSAGNFEIVTDVNDNKLIEITNGKLKIPVKYTVQDIQGKHTQDLKIKYLACADCDLVTPISAVEDYTPVFKTPAELIMYARINERTPKSLSISTENTNVASLADNANVNLTWEASIVGTDKAMFEFAMGAVGNKLSGANVFFTPNNDNTKPRQATLNLTAIYTDIEGNRVSSVTHSVSLIGNGLMIDNTMDFNSVGTITTSTPAFELLKNINSSGTLSYTYEGEISGANAVLYIEPIYTDGVITNYKVTPNKIGQVKVIVTQAEDAGKVYTGKTIEKTIAVVSVPEELGTSSMCADDDFQTLTADLENVKYEDEKIQFFGTITSFWLIQFSDAAGTMTFIPDGDGYWDIQESKDGVNWLDIVWRTQLPNEETTIALHPTTRRIKITYNKLTEVGTMTGLCVHPFTIHAEKVKEYIPVIDGSIPETKIVFTHKSQTPPAINLSTNLGVSTDWYNVDETTDNLGGVVHKYYQTTVNLQGGSDVPEQNNGFTLTATQGGTDEAVVTIGTYTFPKPLPMVSENWKSDGDDDNNTNGYDESEYYYHYMVASKNVKWDAERQNVVFLNTGSKIGNDAIRQVVFGYSGMPDQLTFQSATTDWTIKQSTNGTSWDDMDTVPTITTVGEVHTIVQPLIGDPQYIQIIYNGTDQNEVLLNNIVIEGFPSAVPDTTDVIITKTDDAVTPSTEFNIHVRNLPSLQLLLDRTDAFKLYHGSGSNWTLINNATELTSGQYEYLALNKEGNITIKAEWVGTGMLDEGQVQIINPDQNDSVMVIVRLVGKKSGITATDANTGIWTGVPDGNQYGTTKVAHTLVDAKEIFVDYTYHQVNLAKAFANNKTLFDYLIIFGETTTTDNSTSITQPTADVGSNAKTPYYVYKKSDDNLSYEFVNAIANANSHEKGFDGTVIQKDSMTHIDIPNIGNGAVDSLRIYITGFCPYASTGYTKNEEGVFLFRGEHGDKLHIYLDSCHIYSRNKTQKGSTFYGDKEGGETYSDAYARGSGGVLVFENIDAHEQVTLYDPFEVTIHTIGHNVLNSNHGCFFGLKVGSSVAMKAYQVSSPIQVHMFGEKHINQTRTTLNFDDLWPTAVHETTNNITATERTNGFLALKKQANNAPSIDLGNEHTEVNFCGGQVQLQNSQIGSDTYRTTLAISYRAGFFGADEVGIYLCHGIGTDAVEGVVNFIDGTVTVEKMYVKPEFRQYYLMDTLADGTESDSTSCLRTPKNTYIKGGSVCRVRACQNVTSKGGGPKEGVGGRLLGQYVYIFDNTKDTKNNATGLATIAGFPSCVTDLAGYTYNLNSVTPDSKDQFYFWIPDGYGGVTAEQDVYMATWKACMTKIGAGIAEVARGEVGGDILIDEEEEVKYFLYCQLDQNIYDVINAGPVDANGKKLSYTYQAPIEVPSAAKQFFNGKKYTRWAPNLVGPSKQHEVTSEKPYTITDRVYYITTATADIWQTFTAPFDVQNIYVVETYGEDKLQVLGGRERSQILTIQAQHNADFAAFFGVAMAMGTMDSFDQIYDSYIEWAKIQDKDSLNNWNGAGKYTLRGKTKLIPYFGNNWRDANFYLNVNNGNWVPKGEDTYEVKWEMLPDTAMADNILLHKGKTYSMMFPYCTGCEDSFRDRTYWDYWSGKFLIFESTEAPQTIKGRDFLNETKANNVFVENPGEGEVIVTGNSTFSNLDAAEKDIYVYDNYYPSMKEECFEPVNSRNNIVYPTTSFLYGDVPTNSQGMPARKISRSGQIIYDKENTPTGNQGGNIPTVGGGNDLFITDIVGGVNIAVAEPQHVRVMSATGAIIFSGMVQTAVDVALPTTGVYVITGENEVHKILH